MATPCSVKTKGCDRRPPHELEVPDWYLKLSNSAFVSWNMKSSGKRPRFPLHGTNKRLGLDAVEGREVGIEHHFLTTEKKDGAGDAVDENEGGLGHGSLRSSRGAPIQRLSSDSIVIARTIGG